MEKVEAMIQEGHTVEEACEVFRMPRSSWYGRRSRLRVVLGGKTACQEALGLTILDPEVLGEEVVLEKIGSLVKEHPFWGYRRVAAHLRHRQGLSINRKRVYRLMREAGLLAKVKGFKPERSWKKKPVATGPYQFWGTDMTKFLIPSLGWISWVVVLDWYTKKIVGWSLGLRGDTSLWLQALDEAVKESFPQGSRGKGVKLISDNGSQPTSRRYGEVCQLLEIEQIFTTYDNPKGNADTERVIRTLKEEAIWPYEFETLGEAQQKITERIRFYNESYCHSSLGYQSPQEFLEAYFEKLRIQEAA
jgi:transposase InsO family protein